MLKKLLTMANGMNTRFPNGNKPYEIMTRLLEECGEIASEVNHLENSGTKVLRHGEASKEDLASEIKDAGVLQAMCDKEGIPCHIEPGVGHRMEVIGDIERDLDIISNVVGKLQV